MQLNIQNVSAPIIGEIVVPGDKSISHRAVMLGALAQGETTITHFLPSGDCLGTIACFQQLGVAVTHTHAQVSIQGKGLFSLAPPEGLLDVGNSGTTLRLLSGILAGQSFDVTLSGDASIARRPMDRVVIPLRQMGGELTGQGERMTPPLSIHGKPLHGTTYRLPVASAQVKSALLLAGLYAQGEMRVIEPVPTRDHTERMLLYFGVPLHQEKTEAGLVTVVPGVGERGSVLAWPHGASAHPARRVIQINREKEDDRLVLVGKKVIVPGDLSSAAYWIVAATLIPGSTLRLPGVGVNPTRTGLLQVLAEMGGMIQLENKREVCGEPVADLVVQSASLHGTTVQGGMIPRLIDEFPILVVAATQAQGQTVIRDAAELRVKESDRIATLAAELRKMGAHLEEQPDGMVIEGPTPLRPATCDSHGDHRIAMSLAIAALIATGEAPTHLQNTACIETSYPGFSRDLDMLCSK